MFSKKINTTITLALYVIGILYAISAVIMLVIWFTEMSQINFLSFVGAISAASIWMLFAKLSRYLDERMSSAEDEEDADLPDYLED